MIRSRAIVFLIFCFAAPFIAASSAHASAQTAEIERLLAPEFTQLNGQTLNTKALRAFYAPRAYQPVWPGGGGTALATMKQTAQDHGLDPNAYSFDGGTLSDAAIELSLSAIATRLGRDLATGRIPPYRLIGGLGENTRPHFDGTQFLKELAQGTSLGDLLSRQAPQSTGYLGLVSSLKNLRAIAAAGGWPMIADGPPVKLDESDPRISVLRKHLIISGDLLNTDDEDGTVLDEELSAALKLFQLRHGLDADGALGKRTVTALNVPVSVRIHQVELALERLRQMPHQRESDRIDVNIAAQMLVLYENRNPIMSMRVVAGDVKHQTPTMATRETAITLNPTWTVPSSIARKEILPKLKRDPNYLAHNNIHILDNSPAAADGQQPDGSAIDWSKLGNSFPYVLRQVPGPDNALGRIKFNLQNQDSIYMHDTPQHKFFRQSYRLLSHGCIRLEHPLDLADQLLGAEWHDKLPPLLADGKTKTLIPKHSLPVYLLYQTAWVGADGILSFRDDNYGNDQRLDQALAQSAVFSSRENSPNNL